MDDAFFKRITAALIFLILLVLAFFLLKPILFAIIVGFILAFIFSPVYDYLHKLIKSKNLSVIIICVCLLIIILLPLWFFTPIILNESVKIYHASQQLDLATPLKAIFPSLFASQEFSQEVGVITQTFITKLTNSLVNYLSNFLLDFPTTILQIFVTFFTFFYALRDKDKIISYINGILPFSKETQKKLFDSTRDITFSVIYGNIVVGILQGTILGIGFFTFGVSNALILFLLGIIVGIIPAGATILGVCVIIFLLIGGHSYAAFGILLFVLISSLSDHILRPLLVSRRTRLHNGLVLVGMIGGFLLFGILGFILGPLILAYLIIIIEVYRNKPIPSILIQEVSK
jgi:predicted PurR-regulated permease PerM